MSSEPYVLYLDQNKWIDLARGEARPADHADFATVLEKIRRLVLEGRLVVPLTQSNLYETHKINKLARRNQLSKLQSSISQGWVFRSLTALFRVQLSEFLASKCSVSLPERNAQWFLSKRFFESAAEYDSAVFGFEMRDEFINWVDSNPEAALYYYLINTPDDRRREGVRRYSEGSRALISQLVERRNLVKNETVSLQERAYSVRLIVQRLDDINQAAEYLGLPLWTDVGFRELIFPSIATEVASLDIERALVIKTEGENRELDENDLRDVNAFTSVLPYVDALVAEKAIVARARQARLGERYGTDLHSSLLDWKVPD
jgi:hypothetical protein